eukprot:gb/GECH01004579.1/.p1 GENE.gb/GECH01004579.1/~~gb/GECH01004579.1/.p1  ORF type:complete len:302 (+),score=37.21 gb/GECH01004579.1/:1-906(+)
MIRSSVVHTSKRQNRLPHLRSTSAASLSLSHNTGQKRTMARSNLHTKGKIKPAKIKKKETAETMVTEEMAQAEERANIKRSTEGSLAERKVRTQRYNWEPRDGVERMFQRKMHSIIRSHNFPPPRFVNELLEAVQTPTHFQFAVKLWFQMSVRNRNFDETTTYLMVSKAYEQNQPQVAHKVLENAATLRMPLSSEIWDLVIEQDQDNFPSLYETALGTKLLRPEHHHSVISRLVSAGIPQHIQSLNTVAHQSFKKRKLSVLPETQSLVEQHAPEPTAEDEAASDPSTNAEETPTEDQSEAS